MAAVWLGCGLILILLGLFILTQGGQSLGPTLAGFGAVILLILLVAPARGLI